MLEEEESSSASGFTHLSKLCIKILFERDAFRTILLNEIGVFDGFFEVGLEGKAFVEIRHGIAHRGETWLYQLEPLLYRSLNVFTRIIDGNFPAIGKEQPRPGQADRAGADNGYIAR